MCYQWSIGATLSLEFFGKIGVTMPCGGYATFCAEGLCLVLAQLVLVMSHRWLKTLHNEFLN